MQFDSFTLSEGELGWNVQFPFPSSQRAVIENAIREVNPPAPPYGELDELLAEELVTHGYFSEHANDEEVRLWRPEHQHTVDLYSPTHSIAIEIEKIVAEEQDFNYIDAICYYCETNNIEVESVSKLISKPLKERLKWDATRLNFMKPTSRAKLPL